MIKTVGLSKKFGDTWVLNDLNLEVRRGEFYCLLGPNGAGKTTTLKLLSGLIYPSSGKIYIDGKDIVRFPLKAKSIMGFIPDTPFVYDTLTAREFLTFVGRVFKVNNDVLRERIDEYLEMFGMRAVADYLLKSYSHGMKQRIIYIANFIHNPQVLLVDEPLVGLDPHAIHLIKRLLKEKVKEGMTILMSTHILSIAEELADKIGILYHGKLIAEGTLDDLKRNIPRASLEEIFLSLTEGETPHEI